MKMRGVRRVGRGGGVKISKGGRVGVGKAGDGWKDGDGGRGRGWLGVKGERRGCESLGERKMRFGDGGDGVYGGWV